MKKMGTLGWIAFVLVIIGALNWGMIGFFSYDLVKAIFGDMTTMSRIVYDLVGIAGLGLLIGSMAGTGEE